MHAQMRDADALTPLPYHQAIVTHLKAAEPDVWAWASSLRVQAAHAADARAQLLRDTYRLTPATHPAVYAAAALACERLGIDAPVTLYQAGASTMNAALYYLPGEVHVVLQGAILERLNDAELLAVLGHEFAHYRLWSRDAGDYLAADRILNHSDDVTATPESYIESARLYALHTELYADRGAALAAGDSAAAISTLVKVHTGIAVVDATAYLQQALELEDTHARRSAGVSHPETYLRSQAVDMWWQADPGLDDWLRRRLHGPLALHGLDLTGQVTLTAITRGLITYFLQADNVRVEKTLAQARAYFPDWTLGDPPLDPTTLTADLVDPSAADYLHYVMLDLALCDGDVRDAALARALRIARAWEGADGLTHILKRDLKMNKRQLDKLTRSSAEAKHA
ncbi:M48 family metalloprotease [Schauerella aestuarii]|uniref:M48 family metalloprotease n=1 Tax=Schauerella aestuarii TaxID=2511204 RepID=UPI00136D93FA|nr:M48 family metalloprotease [Achromobacter aestuarii]MYZ44391.1 hydrolase [Achromobacter aestuarii]